MTHSPKKIRLPLDGVLLLDKPAGLSSNDALIKAKRLLNAKKAGHTGTLDPFATGLLPLCFGEATKFAQDLLDADKTYETVVHLGIRTDTGDTEGAVLAQSAVHVTRSQIEAVLAQFRGEIEQVPPMHSALKRDGKPLYEYARAGITLERDARRVIILALELLDYAAPYLRLRVSCSKGTYIRVLGEDIGAALGCGAHLQALRRIRVGNLELEGCVTLDALAATDEADRSRLLAPVDALLSSFPAIHLPATLAQRFLHGQRLALGKEGVVLPADLGRVRVYDESGRQLLGTAQLQEYGILAPERLISTQHP
ncbi:MAG: tRNA pseudouridine(55) synthase TruB [Proteobacteria bacterium]|nr:tRNA pseudouridine(55) synthase TruB [Pseudomonadota bacterium]